MEQKTIHVVAFYPGCPMRLYNITDIHKPSSRTTSAHLPESPATQAVPFLHCRHFHTAPAFSHTHTHVHTQESNTCRQSTCTQHSNTERIHRTSTSTHQECKANSERNPFRTPWILSLWPVIRGPIQVASLKKTVFCHLAVLHSDYYMQVWLYCSSTTHTHTHTHTHTRTCVISHRKTYPIPYSYECSQSPPHQAWENRKKHVKHLYNKF